MKKRRTIIALFLICACLVMSIGYATLSRQLAINGSVKVNTNNAVLDVVFTDAKIVASNKTGAAADFSNVGSAGIGNGITASFDVTGLANKGEYVTAQFTITNKVPDVEAELNLPVITNAYGEDGTKDFKITTNFTEIKVLNSLNEATAAADQSNTYVFTVTVELLKTYTENVDTPMNFTINVPADTDITP